MITKVNVKDSRILRDIFERAYEQGFEAGRQQGFVEGVRSILDRLRPVGKRT